MKNIKEDLPLILERIEQLKVYESIQLMLLQNIQSMIIHEMTDTHYNGGFWARTETYDENLQLFESFKRERKNLEKLTKNIQYLAKNT